ncbi:MAG: respiratory nitrate reductase subunit gamma [Desulfobacterales bacterium]|nr:respiratory nitrate reductase subunit gamma [Desulfobacterales bacterium]MDD3082320.1 respiratory nitrate reductase subunit gamma [Desulfobacterales bacterium]MDD3950973.1 respiratory nitrate reductase subunit gamma [Desulfobacterales bacterium]
MQTLYYVILVPMTYLAFAVFFIGTGLRLFTIYRTPKYPAALQIFPEKHPGRLWAIHDAFLFPTIRKHNPILWIFLMVFHIGFFLLVIGHIELFRKFEIFQIIPHEVFLGRGFVGLILCLSLLFFLGRRFFSPVREISTPGDYFLLILLFLAALFGSQMDWARRWYGYDALLVENYRDYLLSLLYLKPALNFAVLNSGHTFMLVLHVFFANLFLMIFPFSKLMHAFTSVAMNKLRRG